MAYNIIINNTATTNGTFTGSNPDTFTATGDDASADANTISADGASNTGLTIRTGSAGSQVGNITIVASLNDGMGALALEASGAIVQSGVASITAGTLSGSAASVALSATGNQVLTLGAFTTTGDFTLGDASSLTVSGPVTTNGGNLTIDANSQGVPLTLTLNGDLYAGSGSVTLNYGTITQNAGTITASIASLAADSITLGSAVSVSSALSLTATSAAIVTGVVSGSGGLSVDGIGTTTLSGANTYAGGTTIHAGTLDLNHATVGSYGAITSAAAGTGAINFSSGAQTLRVESVALGASDHTLANTITNFDTDGDVIDVRGVGTSAQAHFDYGTNTLTLTDTAGTSTLATLHLTGSYAGKTFTAASDGVDGAQVTLSTTPPASIAGIVGQDNNHNGAHDAGEPGIAGVSVTMSGTDEYGNAAFLTTTTASDGSYAFNNLYGGAYTVTVTVPSGYATTSPTVTFVNARDGIPVSGQNFEFAPSADLALGLTASDTHPALGDVVQFTVSLSNAGPGDASNVSVQDALPAGLTFVSAAPDSGSYNPATGVWTAGQVGSGTTLHLTLDARVTTPDPVTMTASIAGSNAVDPNSLNNTASVTVDANAAPVASGNAYTLAEDTPLMISAPGVLGNDTDADHDVLAAILTTGPAYGTVTLNATGSFVYTPLANYNGSDSFTYRASDGTTTSADTTVTLTVTSVDDAPALSGSGSIHVGQGGTAVITAAALAATDIDTVPGQITYAVTGTTHGHVLLNGADATAFTQADLDAGLVAFRQDGTASGGAGFTVQVSDGVLSGGSKTVTASVDLAPTVTGIAYGANDGTLRAGETVTLVVSTSEAVTVTGTPHLVLNDGGAADYVSGSGTSTLVFTHSVAAGQSATDLAVTGLTLGGGTIQDATGQDLVALPVGGLNPAGVLAVDTTAPTITLALSAGSGSDNHALHTDGASGAQYLNAADFAAGFRLGGTVGDAALSTPAGAVVTFTAADGHSVPVHPVPVQSNGVSYAFRVDAPDTAGGVNHALAAALTDGTYTVTATTQDAAGNIKATSPQALIVDTTADAGHDASLTVADTADHVVNAAEAKTVGFTVAGLDSDATAVATFTDGTHTTTAAVGANGAGTVDLSGFNGAVTSSLAITDVHLNTAMVAGNTVQLDTVATAFRFYDAATGGHFFTTDANEAAQIQTSLPTLQAEASPWTTPEKGADTVDVFRFYDTVTHDHFLTASTTERDALIKGLPTFQYEGVAFQAYASEGTSGTEVLERFYNTVSKTHMYALAAEADGIRHGSAGAGWIDEGKSFVVHVGTDTHA